MFEFSLVLTELQIGWLLLHPEDLGKLKNGDNPASIWQRADVRSILDQSCQARTWVVHLCSYGAEASHPTRAVTNLRGGPRSMPWPMLDGQDCYQGPLGRCGHDHALTRGRLGSQWATQHVIPNGFLSFLLSWRTNASLMIGPLMPRSRELRTLLVPCWSVGSNLRLMMARLCPGSCRLKLRILRCKRTNLQVVVHSLRGPSARARSSVCGRAVTHSLLPCSASPPCCDRLSQARCSAP